MAGDISDDSGSADSALSQAAARSADVGSSGSAVPSGNLYDLFASRFAANGAAACLILEDGAVISYARVADNVGRLASLLIGRGVKPGDRVMAQAPKSAAYLMLYLATLKAGGVFVPLNSAYTSAEMDYFRADAEPALFVDQPEALLAEASKQRPLRRSVAREAQDIAVLIYTSGTTGQPKGAMLSHGALATNALGLIDAWAFTPDDVLLHALPVFHAHGLLIATHCALLTGSAMLWLAKFDVDAVLGQLGRATVMMGVPTFYTRLLAEPRFTRSAAMNVRVFISGSAPLLDATFEAFEERTGKRILERYGMSESMVIASNPLTGERLAGTVGYAVAGTEIRVDCAEGDAGPIQIRGPSVFSGYWRKPDKTAEDMTADGFFITGDVGELDADGCLRISGRAKDLIISGGYNVYPKEVELALDAMVGIEESAVIGVPHPDFGEAVVALAIGRGDEAEVLAHLRERLARFKCPKRIIFVDALPRNAMGKVQKNLLRTAYADCLAEPQEGA